jgi:hypothetical protein
MPRNPQRKPKPRASELSGSVLQRRVVEGQLLQRFAEILEVVGADREQTGVNLRLDAFEAGQHFNVRRGAEGQGVTDRSTVNVFDACDDEAHFAGLQINGRGMFRVEDTPTLSTRCILPVDLTRILSPFFTRP